MKPSCRVQLLQAGILAKLRFLAAAPIFPAADPRPEGATDAKAARRSVGTQKAREGAGTGVGAGGRAEGWED